jgi:hypothetical protein
MRYAVLSAIRATERVFYMSRAMLEFKLMQMNDKYLEALDTCPESDVPSLDAFFKKMMKELFAEAGLAVAY